MSRSPRTDVSVVPPRRPTSVRAPGDVLIHLRKARDHIDRHFTEPIELDDVAAVAGLSKFHFHRLFKAVYGVTPARYLTQRRVERAQDLLRSDEPHRDGDLLRGRLLEPRIVQHPLLRAGGRNTERIPTAVRGVRCATNSQLFPVHVGTRRTSFVLERFRKTGEVVRIGPLVTSTHDQQRFSRQRVGEGHRGVQGLLHRRPRLRGARRRRARR